MTRALHSGWTEAVVVVRGYAPVFLVLFALLLLATWGTPRLWLAVTPFVLGLALLLFWGARHARPEHGKSGRSAATLQTTVFRSVIIALLAVFGLVMLTEWWDQRQSAQATSEKTTSREWAILSRGQLDLAYLYQPSSTVAAKSGDLLGLTKPFPRWTGLWVDLRGYRRIRAIINRIPDNGGALGLGQMSLARGELWPGASILTPAQLRSFNGPHSTVAMTGFTSWSWARRIGGLPPDAPSAAYLRQHGYWIGQEFHESDPGNGEARRNMDYHWAVWRTGPDTVFVAGSYDNPNPWPSQPPRRLLQALYLLLFLAPVAGVTAWYVNGRIVRPVEQVAAASVALADGRLPDPIPEKGPAELATLAESFNHMSQKLGQAEAAQQQFLSSVSHELKTPLAAIEGYAELLGEGAVPPGDAAKVVAAESGRLKRLVADLIDLGKIGQSTFTVRAEPVDLRRVAGEVGRRYAPRAQEFGVGLRVLPPEGTPGDVGSLAVTGDEDRLVQVVSNLVENALRCTLAGGQVTIETTPPGSLRVRDTGPGLGSDDVKHAFERFYLYDRCSKDRQVGTGLGLAIVKELTEAMGGAVKVESALGVGTTFTVGLPPAEARAGSA